MRNLTKFLFLFFCFCWLNTNAQNLYLTGDATPCGWTNTQPIKMSFSESDGKYVWEGTLKKGGFKLLTKLKQWGSCYNAAAKNTIVRIDGTESHKLVYNWLAIFADHKFEVPRKGNYKVTADLKSKQITVKEIKGSNTEIICVGNSITEGVGLGNNTYPATLERSLGENYQVLNLGASGRTQLKRGDSPYWNDLKYTIAKNSNPDIVIIKLGSNDSKPINDRYRADFKKDLTEMVNAFSALPSKPQIYLSTPLFVKPKINESTARHAIRGSIIEKDIIPAIKQVAKEQNLEIINFWEMSYGWGSDMYTDGIHPNAKGTAKMAEFVANTLTKKSPIITISNNIEFPAAIVDVTNATKVNLKAMYLSGNLTATVKGEGFSCETKTITKEQAENANGYDLEVLFKPTVVKENYAGTLTISGNNLPAKTINISGNGRELYITGSATPTGWINNNPEMKMTPENDKLVWTGILKAEQFKFITQLNNWYQCYNSMSPDEPIESDGSVHNIAFIPNAERDYKFMVQTPGLSTVVVDMRNQTVWIHKHNTQQEDDLWATGSALGGKIVKLEKREDKYLLIARLQQGELKLMNSSIPNSTTNYIVPNLENANIVGITTIKTNADSNRKGWMVQATPNPNTYHIMVVDLENLQAHTNQLTPNSQLYLVGGATEAGWNLQKAIQFSQDPEEPRYLSLECELKINPVSEGNRFKMIGQRSWMGWHYCPEMKDEILEESTEVIMKLNPSAFSDTKWTVNPDRQGRYRLTLDVFSNIMKAEYLEIEAPRLKSYNHSVMQLDLSNSIKVYSKQAGNIDVTINSAENDLFTNIQIVTIGGKVITSKSGKESNFSFDNIPSGIYIVSVSCNNEIFSQKIYVR